MEWNRIRVAKAYGRDDHDLPSLEHFEWRLLDEKYTCT